VPEPPESVTANAVSSTGTMPVQAEVEAVARLARMVVLAVAIGNVRPAAYAGPRRDLAGFVSNLLGGRPVGSSAA
jgi:hypothetical protein